MPVSGEELRGIVGPEALEAHIRMTSIPKQAKFKDKVLLRLHDRLNNIIDIVKTGKFLTSNQACIHLDRKIVEYRKQAAELNKKLGDKLDKQGTLDAEDRKFIDESEKIVNALRDFIKEIKKKEKDKLSTSFEKMELHFGNLYNDHLTTRLVADTLAEQAVQRDKHACAEELQDNQKVQVTTTRPHTAQAAKKAPVPEAPAEKMPPQQQLVSKQALVQMSEPKLARAIATRTRDFLSAVLRAPQSAQQKRTMMSLIHQLMEGTDFRSARVVLRSLWNTCQTKDQREIVRTSFKALQGALSVAEAKQKQIAHKPKELTEKHEVEKKEVASQSQLGRFLAAIIGAAKDVFGPEDRT